MGAPDATQSSILRLLPSTQSFPPSARLRKPAQFASALKGRRIGRSDWLMLSVARTHGKTAGGVDETARVETAGETTQARLGLIIAKRYAKLAVTRNAIKRTLREAFRQQWQTLPARDYVFRLHCRVEHQPLAQLKQHVRGQAQFLLQQARLRAS